jgi:two-component system, cell cycle sensor histidine kinase and response regulator CckA
MTTPPVHPHAFLDPPVPDPAAEPPALHEKTLVEALRGVLAAADELLACPDTDTLFRRAVELSRDRLGLERCSIFLEEGPDEGGAIRGTFGTDGQGRTSDERGCRLVKSAAWRARLEELYAGGPRWTVTEEPYSEWDGETMVAAGEGWIAITPIHCSAGRIGFLCNDTAISRSPLDPVRQEAAAILCSLLGTIVEQKRAEQALHESEVRYRRIVETAYEGVWALDGGAVTTYVNRRMAEMLGYSTAQMLGRSMFDFMEEAQRAAARGSFQRQRAGVAEQHEFCFSRKDGSPLWTLCSTSPIWSEDERFLGALAMITDITERKQAEDALRRSEERLRIASESVSDLIYEWDLATNDLQWFGNIDQQLGYSPREFPRTIAAWKAMIHPEDRDRVTAAITRHLATRHPFCEEYRVLGKDGVYRYWTDRGTAIWDGQGRPRRLIGVCTDVSDRMLLEERLRQSQKMEAVGRLAGGVAHDFNNMLAVINGYTELLLNRLPAGDASRASLEEVRKAGERAAGLTRQLLAFSRKQVLSPQVLDLNEVVTGIHRMLRRLIGEDIELVTVPEAALGQVRADPGQIEQVLMNLIVNARDAMPQGGRLTVRTQNVILDELLSRVSPELSPGPYVLLSVSDTGVGMDRETQSHIFEPFFTTKEVGKGTGLGLATVYGIVQQSGGHIRVLSEPGEGATFEIYLPRVDDVLSPRCEPELGNAPPAPRETVLLVEDEPMVREFVRDVLRMNGYTVLEASEGEEAVRIFHAHRGSIDLLLSDVVMPRMSGREVAERLTAFRPGLKVLFMTGYTDDAVVRHGIQGGETALIQKPFTPLSLGRKIREVLEKP